LVITGLRCGIVAPPSGTRQRLLDAGMHLFATRGFAGTTVGAIESAAGLQPRRGALYKHFPSKEALLDAAVARHLDAVATGAGQLAELSIAGISDDDLDLARALVVEIGRWFLDELDRQHDLTRILEQDGERLAALRDVARERIVETGYRAAAGLARGVGVTSSSDPDAIAVVLMGSLVGLRRTTWTFGEPPLGLDDDRVLATWAEACIEVLRRFRDRADPPGPRADR
jgi:AcrR family transcriptional regulator